MAYTYLDWALEYPDHVIIKKEGSFYAVRHNAAQLVADLCEFELGPRGVTGSPNPDKMTEALKYTHTNYLVVNGTKIEARREFEDSHFRFSYRRPPAKNTLDAFESIDEALGFVKLLLEGVDPATGSIEEEGLLVDERFRQVVQVAEKAIAKRKRTRSDRPACAGMPWTAKEDELLRREFLSGKREEELGRLHARSVNAVRSRLIHLFPEMISAQAAAQPALAPEQDAAPGPGASPSPEAA